VKLHAPRRIVTQELQHDTRVSEMDMNRFIGWNTWAPGTYLDALSPATLFRAAGIDPGDTYHLPQNDEDIAPEMLAQLEKAVFPMFNRYLTPGYDRVYDRGTRAFIDTFFHMRRQFIRTSPRVRRELPRLGLWRRAPFNTDLFDTYSARILEHCDRCATDASVSSVQSVFTSAPAPATIPPASAPAPAPATIPPASAPASAPAPAPAFSLEPVAHVPVIPNIILPPLITAHDCVTAWYVGTPQNGPAIRDALALTSINKLAKDNNGYRQKITRLKHVIAKFEAIYNEEAGMGSSSQDVWASAIRRIDELRGSKSALYAF
jgi:hypothetical protein